MSAPLWKRNCKFKEKVSVFRYWKEKQAAFRAHPVENELLFCRRSFSWRRVDWPSSGYYDQKSSCTTQQRVASAGEVVLRPHPVTSLFVACCWATFDCQALLQQLSVQCCCFPQNSAKVNPKGFPPHPTPIIFFLKKGICKMTGSFLSSSLKLSLKHKEFHIDAYILHRLKCLDSSLRSCSRFSSGVQELHKFNSQAPCHHLFSVETVLMWDLSWSSGGAVTLGQDDNIP